MTPTGPMVLLMILFRSVCLRLGIVPLQLSPGRVLPMPYSVRGPFAGLRGSRDDGPLRHPPGSEFQAPERRVRGVGPCERAGRIHRAGSSSLKVSVKLRGRQATYRTGHGGAAPMPTWPRMAGATRPQPGADPGLRPPAEGPRDIPNSRASPPGPKGHLLRSGGHPLPGQLSR